MTKHDEWVPFSWHCPNCGALVTGYSYTDSTGTAVPSTVSDEAAAGISIREQEQKRAEMLGAIIASGGENNG